MTENLSLYKIASGLAQLVQLRDDETLTEEEREAVDLQIREFMVSEIRKVDAVRGYLLSCQRHIKGAEEEKRRVSDYIDKWKAREERTTNIAKTVMEGFIEPDRKGKIKLEGKAGSLAIAANGGQVALEITQPELIPDDLCRYEGWISPLAYSTLFKNRTLFQNMYEPLATCLRRVPDTQAIRTILESGDTVPGAHLLPRGSRLVVK